MYTDAISAQVNAQRSRRLVWAFSILAVAFIVMIVGLVTRKYYLATYVPAAIGCLFYAVLELKALPYARYARYLRDIKEGLSHEMDAEFVSFSDEPRTIDGVSFYDLIVRVGPDEEDERLFHFDAAQPLPDIKPGQQLSITSFGNFVTGLESGGRKLC